MKTLNIKFNLLSMVIEDTVFGSVDLIIYVDRLSTVDSYIEKGTKEDGTELNNTELDILSRTYDDVIQDFCYSNGSRNHN